MNDTSPSSEKILIDGYRAMAPWQKLRQVSQLTAAVQQMALSRIQRQYGMLSEREELLRMASLRLPRETMVRLFSWDPEKEGY